VAVLADRLKEPRRFIQVVAGPRQVGKTTMVLQATDTAKIPIHYASADEPTLRGECNLYYWRHRNHEVDFIVKSGQRLTAIEVKSGRSSLAHPGTAAFVQAFRPQNTLLVGGDGIAIEDFLMQLVEHWVS